MLIRVHHDCCFVTVFFTGAANESNNGTGTVFL